jgi:hypothetical protein
MPLDQVRASAKRKRYGSGQDRIRATATNTIVMAKYKTRSAARNGKIIRVSKRAPFTIRRYDD